MDRIIVTNNFGKYNSRKILAFSNLLFIFAIEILIVIV